MRSVVNRNVVMWRIPVFPKQLGSLKTHLAINALLIFIYRVCSKCFLFLK